MKIIRFFLILNSLLFLCCKSNYNIGKHEPHKDYQSAYTFLVKDSIFINRVKNYYSVLYKCEKINFIVSDLIEPVEYNDFPSHLTFMTEKIKRFDSLSEDRRSKIFDSIYSFPSFLLNFKNKHSLLNNNCDMRLNFARRIDNLMPIKITHVPEFIDPRINYNPRELLYVLKFNNKNEIIDRSYLLMSN